MLGTVAKTVGQALPPNFFLRIWKPLCGRPQVQLEKAQRAVAKTAQLGLLLGPPLRSLQRVVTLKSGVYSILQDMQEKDGRNLME
jgi:hypothetical protein